MTSTDQDWAALAHASGQALSLLGYPVPPCLPDDTEPCGGNFATHLAANLAALSAVIDHHLAHLNPPGGLFTTVYHAIETEIEAKCQPA